MPQVRYAKLCEPAVLCRMRGTYGYCVSVLRYVSVFIVRILPQLRCAVGRGRAATGETAQADVRLGKIRDSAVCTRSALHHYRPYICYAEAGSRAIYGAAYKILGGRRRVCNYRFAPDVQRLK